MAGDEAKAADPKALEVKYTYPDAAKDDAAIKKVEDAVAQRFPGSFQEGLKESTKGAPIDEEEARAKLAEAKEKEAQEKASGSDEVKKEMKEDPPPPMGAPAKPQVNKANVPAPVKADPKKGGAGAAAHKDGKEGAKPGAAAKHPVPQPPQAIALRGSSMSDAELDAYLNAYPTKGKDTTEKLSKIKEMAKVAESFDGKVEEYVTNGGGALEAAKGKLVNFLGKKELTAIFSKNPYEKVEGGLGTLMRVLSTINSVVSIVGGVCGKLGMILTIVGLFGMIFPPIGAAVSAVARVLNIVGIICDVLGLALNGVLTGLNGMVLAKQIAKGGSNEEKAATADMMISEATSAGGHVMSLAMTYGPKFMKGFKAASKGVIGQLFTRFKAAVGKFAAKSLGPVANWAKNIGYKLGFGLEKAAGESVLKKAWNAPGKMLEKVRDTAIVKKINNSSFMQGLERGAGAINNSKFVKMGDAVDKFAEGMGEKAGEKVAGMANKVATKVKPNWEDSLKKSIDADNKAAEEAARNNAAQNAANRESAKIDRDIKKNTKEGNKQTWDSLKGDKIDEKKFAEGGAAYDKAAELKAGKADAVAEAKKKGGGEDFDAAQEEKKAKVEAKEIAEKKEERHNEAFNKDPKKYQDDTKRFETQIEKIEEKLKDQNLPAAEREALEAKKHKFESTVSERKMTGLKASGGEAPETVWDVKKAYKEGKESLSEGWGVKSLEAKDDSYGKMKEEAHEKAVEDISKTATSEAKEEKEKEEQHSNIEAWSEAASPTPQTTQQVDAMLSGLDEELGLEPSGDEHESDEKDSSEPDGDPQQQSLTPPPVIDEGKQEPPQQDTKEEEKKEDVPAIPALEYWPNLTKSGGDFESSAKELHRMKQIAYAFYKAQAEAKKKALETAEGLGKAGEDATKKQAGAQTHAADTAGTIKDAQTSAGAANTATASTAKGQKAQDDGHSNAGGEPQAAPDPGEKPSRWHPIKRIWWYVKKWAADKAAKVFGWIQEKIASLVLNAICGVSMGDMKAYTTALNHRMQYSQMVGTQGVEAANKAMAEAAKTKTESKSYADQALDDAKDCDQNMADADAFIKSVDATEQDLVAEHARATTFLADLHAAVQAEKQRKKEEAAKKAAEQKAAAAATGAAPAATAAAATPAKSSADAGKKEKPKAKPLSSSAISKVKGAAGYVVSQANLLIEQLTSSRSEQASRLKAVLEEKKKATREAFEKREVGASALEELKKGVTPILTSMEVVKNASPTAAGELKSQAGTIKSKAAEVDELAIHAHEALNFDFKSTYEAVAKSA